MRALVLTAVVLVTKPVGAEENTTLTVTGSSAAGFGSRAKEGERPRDTPDTAALLEGLPGLRVRRTGAESSFATVSIRGAASNQLAISFAGIPLTGAADPSIDLATLPLWPGAVVRVHRTFAPAHLGGGYLGGIIDLQPMELSSRPSTEVYNAFASFGTYRLRIADTRATIAGFRVGAGVSFVRTDGDFTYLDHYVQRDRVRRNSESTQLAGVVHARRDGEHWSWLATFLGSLRKDGIAGTIKNPSFATEMARDRQLASVEARRRDDDGRSLFRVWARRDGRSFDDPRAELGLRRGGTTDRVLALGGVLGRSHRFSDLVTLDARLESSVESSRGTRLEIPPVTAARDRTRVAAAFDVLLQPNRQTTLALAARADLFNDVGATTVRQFLPVAHLGLEQQLFEQVTLGAHVGTLARPPSFLELLGDGGVYSPSPDLKSERAYAADIGVRARTGKTVRFELEAVAFGWEVQNLIVALPKGIQSLQAHNIGNARVLGAEVSVAGTAGPVRAIVSYTRLHTEDRTTSAPSRGMPLPGRPAHDLTTDVSVRVGPVVLRYGFDVVSATPLDRAGINVMPTRMYHGAGARLDLKGPQTISILAEVFNIFDQRSADVLYDSGASQPFRAYPIGDFVGYPLPGRRFNLAVRGSL